MTAPIERLRAVLGALDGPLTLNGHDGVILDRYARVVARAPLLSQHARGGRAEAEAIAALGTLYPALLAVAEAAHARRTAADRLVREPAGEPVESAGYRSLCVAIEAENTALDALDAAIAAALPEAP